MRMIAITATFFLLFAVSASSQQGEAAGNTTYNPTRAFLLSAADVAESDAISATLSTRS